MSKKDTVQANPNLVVVLHYLFKVIPFLISGAAIYLGYKLFILGVTGKASLSVNSKEISGQLLNAAPGLFFAVGGIVTSIVAVIKGAVITMPNIQTQTSAEMQALQKKMVAAAAQKSPLVAAVPPGITLAAPASPSEPPQKR